MNQIQIPYNFQPRDYQLDVFQALDGIEGDPASKIKRVFLMWHRRCGKDTMCAAYVFKEMMARPGLYYYFFPTYSQGKKAIWEHIDSRTGFRIMSMMYGFHDKTTHGKPGSLIKSVNNQELKLELTNGSIFRIIGTDNYDSIRGSNPTGCIFSEYAFQDPGAWEAISPILAENGGWAIFNSTPQGRNHFYKMYQNVRFSKNWHTSVMQTLYPSEPNFTGLVSADIIESERESGKDEDMIAQEYGCSFSAAAKGSYYNDLIERAREQNRIGEFPADDSRWTETAWDLGYDDSTAVWFFQREGSKIFLVDYYEDSGKPLSHYIEMLQKKGYRYSQHHLPHDAGHTNYQTGKTTEDIFEECVRSARIGGQTYIIPRKNVQAGIDITRHIFSRFYFNEGTCAKGLELLGLYHKRYDEKRQVFLPQPVHDFTSHCADAFRYLSLSDDAHIDEDEHFSITMKSNPYDY
jgi:hypothetical protein